MFLRADIRVYQVLVS